MKAIVITAPGGPEVLQLKEVPNPEIALDEILIQVAAAGINRPDVFQRKGNYPAPAGVPADIPGLEVAGVVAAIGPNVTMWQVGDRVCALVAGGGYAELVKVREGQCLPIPEKITFVQAASLPETVFTVWSNVFWRGGLLSGEKFLVHGGSSGIGVAAIQLAKLFGAQVFTTVGSDAKGEFCLQLGADKYINYKQDDFGEILSNEKIDVILDMIGGDYFAKNIQILQAEGRLVYINAMQGNKVELNIGKIMQKRLTVTGSTLRAREYAFKKSLALDITQKVWPLLATGQFKPIVYKTFPLADAAAAHTMLESSEHIGKIILTV